MARYRHHLPQGDGGAFLSGGGLETTLVFHRGLDLPHFAAFPLLDSEQGRAELTAYFETYLRLAQDHGLGFILDTVTWRANPDWGLKLGYDVRGLRDVNRRAVEFAAGLRDAWERPGLPIVIDGVIGPRGDGYKDGRMEAGEAAAYHAAQITAFAEAGADMVSAMTMNNVGEAIGITRAAQAAGMPCVISFTVETDGRLAGGTTLREAIALTDAATVAGPAYYMVNCAHPTHFDEALGRGEAWVGRLGGIRANASTRSHAELDEATTLDIGDPADLGARYRELRRRHPGLRMLGGCCGTDHRHLQAICEAWP